MEALTGARKRVKPSKETSCLSLNMKKSKGEDFVPQLYKAQTSKKIRTEPPDPNFCLQDLPCDTEAALRHIKNICTNDVFCGRLPPIMLFSQVGAIIKNRSMIESQLTQLAKQNKIITFSTFTTSNYLIVFYEDFINIEREELFHRFINDVVATKGGEGTNNFSIQRCSENSKYFSKASLRKDWKFEEDDIRKLVNGGYLGVQEGGYYCMSLPGAGEFIKAYQRGKAAVLGAIRKAKFSEVLQKDLERRPMKKTAVLGTLYHIYDLLGSKEIEKVDTTSGPLLRIKRN